MVNTRFSGKAAASFVALGKPVFVAVSQIGGRRCARRRQDVDLQPVQDAEIVELTRVSIYQQYTDGDAPLAYFAHKTVLRELVFMASQPLLTQTCDFGSRNKAVLPELRPRDAPDPEVIWCTPVA